MTGAPWTFEAARQKCIAASKAQESAEKSVKQAAQDAALAEERYRIALAVAIVKAHDDDAVAWSVAPDLARGDKHVAELRRKRDIAEGVREALTQAAWRRTADRKDCARFTEWSMRREMAEGAGMTPEPEFTAPIGAGAAR